jgi:hypothetical protein
MSAGSLFMKVLPTSGGYMGFLSTGRMLGLHPVKTGSVERLIPFLTRSRSEPEIDLSFVSGQYECSELRFAIRETIGSRSCAVSTAGDGGGGS